jgi:hypothetical protein
MFKYVVRIHPMESGRPKLSEFKFDKEFEHAYEAQAYINRFNEKAVNAEGKPVATAVYRGKFNSVTGKLV